MKKPSQPNNRKRTPPIILEGVRLIYRNFSGKATKYNAEGNRNFSVVLTDAMAKELESLGVSIKKTNPREEGDLPLLYVQVKANFSSSATPPHITIIRNGKQNILDESSVHILDWAKIINADLSIVLYSWEVQGKKGFKPYLKSLYATLEVDRLEEKYQQ